MIRREITRGGEKLWMFIAQAEHAALASYLACHWAEFPGISSAAREQLLVGILTHDNGWTAWEADPKFDAARGRPYDFMEMPGTSMLPVWTASIDACEELGSLAAYAASGHFAALLEHHLARLTGKDDQRRAKKFLEEEASRRERCELAWTKKHGAESAAELPLAVKYLQAFDAISLWFCCAERTTPGEFAVPATDGTTYTLTPSVDDPMRIALDPWPLFVPSAELSVEADLFPDVRFKDARAMDAARLERALLEWTLEPKDA